MKKIKIRIIGIITIVIILVMPLVVFTIQDYQNIDKQIAWQNSSLDKELMEKYPIINDIYNEYLEADNLNDNYEQYVIKNKDNYSKEKQLKLEEFKKLFEQEVNSLLQKEVISYELLELDENLFQVDFGTIIDQSINNQGKYILDQIYRFNTDNDNAVNFTMNANSKKITYLSISNHLLTKLTKTDLKKMAWQMIEYLELDKIDDWVYTDFGYESYQAKLRIICDLSEFSGNYNLYISAIMLGSDRSLIIE